MLCFVPVAFGSLLVLTLPVLMAVVVLLQALPAGREAAAVGVVAARHHHCKTQGEGGHCQIVTGFVAVARHREKVVMVK